VNIWKTRETCSVDTVQMYTIKERRLTRMNVTVDLRSGEPEPAVCSPRFEFGMSPVLLID